jgi:hypothetical protein
VTTDHAVIDAGNNWIDLPPDGFDIALSAVFVELDDFGLGDGDTVGDIRVMLGMDYGSEMAPYGPGLGLVGGFHAAVPLPLPIVLFGSGLAFLGFIGRRKQQAS